MATIKELEAKISSLETRFGYHSQAITAEIASLSSKILPPSTALWKEVIVGVQASDLEEKDYVVGYGRVLYAVRPRPALLKRFYRDRVHAVFHSGKKKSFNPNNFVNVTKKVQVSP